MKIDMSARHMEITESMRSYTNSKFGALDKFLKSLTGLTVVFESKSTTQHIVEVIAHIDNHENIVVKKEDKDFYACIDKVQDILSKRLKQVKGKSQDKKRRSGRIEVEEK